MLLTDILIGSIAGAAITSILFCLYLDWHRQHWYEKGKNQAKWEEDLKSGKLLYTNEKTEMKHASIEELAIIAHFMRTENNDEEAADNIMTAVTEIVCLREKFITLEIDRKNQEK